MTGTITRTIAFAGFVLLLHACDTAESSTCDVESCPAGCCTSAGECVAGRLNSACGTGGGQCVECAGNEWCTAGICKFQSVVPTDAGGDVDGGGQADGGSADGGENDGGTQTIEECLATCQGCCTSAAACVSGNLDTECGRAEMCTACADPQVCSSGECITPLSISAPDFAHGASIPARFTCDGADLAPALNWSGVPDGTQSLALIVDDPDAPAGTWVHWVVVDLPPTSTGLPEGGALPTGARSGTNDWGRTGYDGPCPPSGTHRYFFKLYALDIALPSPQAPTKAQVEAAMQGHVLAHAEWMGRYSRP